MRWLPPRNTDARDALVASVALVGGAGLVWLGTQPLVPMHPHVPAWAYLLPLVVASAGLALRRRAPLAGLAIGAAAMTGDVALGGSLATALVFTQVLYEACLHGPPGTWRWLLRISTGVTAAAVVAVLAATGYWRAGAWAGVVSLLLLVFPVVTGLSVRQYRDQAEAAAARAEQTARLAELDRAQAVTAERRRMARELHDVIANHLSAVSIHATAAQAAGDDPAAVRAALDVIRASAVAGLAEMRRMIRLLREPDQPSDAADLRPVSPAPSGPGGLTDSGIAGGRSVEVDATAGGRLAEAEELVTAARRAGLRVDFAISGTPRPLPVEVDLAAYRILQEGLTNALKHGRGAPVRASVAYHPGRVTVTVANPLDRANGTVAMEPGGAGAGVIGMRERAALLGGDLYAGPAGEEWRVHAELPAGRPPAGESPAGESPVGRPPAGGLAAGGRGGPERAG